MSTGLQTADGPKFDTPRNEEQGRPGVQRIKEICDAVAEKGLGEVQGKLIEKSGDWKSEQISEVNEQAHTHTHTLSRRVFLKVSTNLRSNFCIATKYINFIGTSVREHFFCDLIGQQ